MDDAATADEVLDIEGGATRWAPPEGVTRHSGDPIESDADFFAEPPPEVGELISADSTLKTKSRPWKLASRIVLTGLIGWGGYMLADQLSKNAHPINQAGTFQVIVAFTVVLTPIVWFLTRFSRTCSFVGKQGIARFKCVGSRRRLRAPEVFFFQNAAELRTSQTRMYQHGIYTGTSYQFVWTDAQGNKVFKLNGTYRGEKKPPKPSDAFHFAQMSEAAWSAFLFDRVVAELTANQSVRFRLGGVHFIAVGPGFLDVFVSGSEPLRLMADEIDGMQADAGVIKIKRIDAQEGWFSSTGVYKFNYNQMANTRLFMLLYSKLIGT